MQPKRLACFLNWETAEIRPDSTNNCFVNGVVVIVVGVVVVFVVGNGGGGGGGGIGDVGGVGCYWRRCSCWCCCSYLS